MQTVLHENIQNLKCKTLRYYVNKFIKEKAICKRNEMLVTRIMPLIRIICSSEHADWVQRKNNYTIQKALTERRALREINQKYFELKKRISKAGLLSELSIQACIFDIEKTLDGSDRWVKPSYIRIAYEQVVHLCKALLILGKDDLVKDYVEIGYKEQYQDDPQIFKKYVCLNCQYKYDEQSALKLDNQPIIFDQLDPEWDCPGCGSSKEEYCPIFHLDGGKKVQIPIIRSTSFSPSIHELSNLEDILFSDSRYKGDRTWVSWNNLYSIEWGLNLDRYFFRDKELAYNSPKACARSAFLLCLHSLHCEIKAVKKKLHNKRRVVFSTPERINKNLNVIIIAINNSLKDKWINSPQNPFPYSLEVLIQNDTELNLVVEWEQNLFEVFHMHSFHYVDFSAQNTKSFNHIVLPFIEKLLENPGVLAEIPVNNYENNATKLLQRVGFIGVLYELFIGEKKIYSAMLRSRKISLYNQPAEILERLHKHLEKLDPIPCTRCHKFYCHPFNICIKSKISE